MSAFIRLSRVLVAAAVGVAVAHSAVCAEVEGYRIGFIHDGAHGFAGHYSSYVVRVGRRVLAGSPSFEPYLTFAKTYDARTGEQRLHLEPPSSPDGYSSFGRRLAASPSGMLIADTHLHVVYDVGRRDGRVRAEYRPPPGTVPEAFGLALARVGRYVAVGDPEAGAVRDPNPPFNVHLGSGEVYLYAARRGRPLGRVADPNPIPGGRFGETVVRCRDGFAVGRVPVATTPGAVYIYDRRGELVQTLMAPTPAIGDLFGAALAASGRRLLVGAPNRFGDGTAYVFERRKRQWELARTLQFPDAASNPRLDGFGRVVALAGRRAAVGGGGFANAEQVVVFDVRTGAVSALVGPPAFEPETDESETAAWSGFGTSIALVGRTIVVTTDGSDESARALVVGFFPESLRRPRCDHPFCP